MNQFIQNHPFWTAVLFVYILFLSKFIIRAVYQVVKANYKSRIKELKTQIKFNEDYSRSIERDYISLLEEQNLRQKIKVVVTDKDIETAVKAFNKGNKDFPLITREQVTGQKTPTLPLDKVEDMVKDLQRMIRENQDRLDRYPELCNSFNEASNHIRNLELQKTMLEQEIKRLRSENKMLSYLAPDRRVQTLEEENDTLNTLCEKLIKSNDELRERCRKMDARIAHKKYVPKSEEKETGYWKCTKEESYVGFFKLGEVYQQSVQYAGNGNLYLLSGGVKYLVSKADFTPAQVPEICVKEHEKGIASESN